MTACLSEDQRNQANGTLRAGTTVNNIAHHFGYSRQTIHNLVNRYNNGSVRDSARPSRAHATMLHTYPVITLNHLHNHFYQQPLLLGTYGVHSQTIIYLFMQNNRPGIFQHHNARLHTTHIATQCLAQNDVNVLP